MSRDDICFGAGVPLGVLGPDMMLEIWKLGGSTTVFCHNKQISLGIEVDFGSSLAVDPDGDVIRS